MNIKDKLPAIVAVAVGIAIVVVGAILLLNRAKVAEDVSAVTVQKDGGTLTVRRDGFVSYKFGDELYEDKWDKDKTDTYFKYFSKRYLTTESELITGGQNSVTITVNGQSKTYVLPGDDELPGVVIDDTTGGGGGGGGGGGTSTTPTATPYSGSGSSTPTPTPYVYTPDPNCLYWRLSYCVIPKTPTPAPTTTAAPEIREPDCSQNTQTGKTVISNQLCLPTPSPTPTP